MSDETCVTLCDGEERAFDLVALGRTYTDVIGHVTQEFLDKHKIIKGQGPRMDNDAFRVIEEDLLKIDPAAAEPAAMAAGGTSSNTAAIVAAMGGSAGFFGKVSDDKVGRFFLDDFDRRDVKMCCEPFEDKAIGLSARCLVLLTEDGDRSFVLTPGCADAYRSDDFESFDFACTHFFLIDAEILTMSSVSGLLQNVSQRAAERAKLVVNVHNIPSWLPYKEEAEFIAKNAQMIVGNKGEIDLLSEAAKLHTRDDQIIITTMGEEGVEARRGGCSLFVPATKPQTFVSSVGAGDAFTGGLLASLARGQEMGAALVCGTRAAAFIIEEEGARPTRKMKGLFL